jgi:hypothetical protein
MKEPVSTGKRNATLTKSAEFVINNMAALRFGNQWRQGNVHNVAQIEVADHLGKLNAFAKAVDLQSKLIIAGIVAKSCLHTPVIKNLDVLAHHSNDFTLSIIVSSEYKGFSW